jgi:hypothetical protein
VRYAEALLNHALAERDTERPAWSLVTDEHPEVDEALSQELAEALESQPDAVYVFTRTRLGGGRLRWLPRLKRAAERSLEIMIRDGTAPHSALAC